MPFVNRKPLLLALNLGLVLTPSYVSNVSSCVRVRACVCVCVREIKSVCACEPNIPLQLCRFHLLGITLGWFQGCARNPQAAFMAAHSCKASSAGD